MTIDKERAAAVFRRYVVCIISCIKKREWCQGLLLGLLVIVPIGMYLTGANRVLVPANILPECCGWNYDQTEDWSPVNRELSDTVDYILPMKVYTYEQLTKGDIPYWNPYYFGGAEFFSNSQSAVLHPTNILFFIVAPIYAHTISVLLNIFLLIFGTYILLRRVGTGVIAAAFGSLASVATPWVMFWLEWGTIGWIMASWSIILYCLYRFQETKYQSSRWLVCATILAGVQVYFGHLQFSLFTFVIVGVWWLVTIGLESRKLRARLVIIMMFSLITSLLISAFSLINTLTMASDGHRTDEGSIVGLQAIMKSDIYPLFQFITLTTDNTAYVPSTIQLEVVRLFFVIGIGILISTIMRRKKFFKRSDHATYFFVAVFILGIGFAFSLPIFREVLVSLPVGKGMLHHYFIALSVITMPLLAALTLDKLLKVPAFPTRLGSMYGAISVLVAVGILLYMITQLQLFVVARVPVVYGFLCTIIALLAVMVSYLGYRKVTRVIGVFICVGIVLHMYGYLYAYIPMPKASSYYTGSYSLQCVVQDSLDRGINFPRALSVLSANPHMIEKISVLNGYDSLYPKTARSFHDALNYPQVQRRVYGNNALLSVNFSKQQLNYNLGVNYIIDYANRPKPDGYELICNDPTGRFAVFRANSHAEVVYFAHTTRIMSLGQQLDVIRSGDMEAHEVLVEESSRQILPGISEVNSYSIEGNTIKARVDVRQRNGLLYIGQSYNQGWVAKVDGKTVSITRANYGFMAVTVPNGVHTVELVFKPKNLTPSVIISIIGFIAAPLMGYYLRSVNRMSKRL